jgi:hypothetical protein
MSTFNDAVESIKEYGSDNFLGRLAWYTVSEDLRVPYDEFLTVVKTEFADVVMDQPILDEGKGAPLFPLSSNVFKRACTAANRKNVPTQDPEIRYNYLLRPTGADAKQIWQTIVREAVDSEGHKLNYTELVRVTFTRASDTIRFDNVNPEDEEDEAANEIAEAIVGYFKDNLGILNAYTIREWLRRYLDKGLSSVRVRPSGGVYFVSEDSGPAIEALDRMFNGFGHAASFHYLPLLDDSKQREMLRVAFENESVGAIDEMIGDIAEILKSGKQITSDKFADFKVEYNRLKSKTADYSELLEDKLSGTEVRLELMATMLIDLMSKVKI